MNRIVIISFMFLFSCSSEKQGLPENPYVMVLGVAQDAGYPQANCNKKCCKNAWEYPEKRKFVSCLALVDPKTKN